MSRNSKNARNLAKARDITRLHQSGERGAAKTNPQHGKKNAWFQKQGGYHEFINGGKKRGRQNQAEGS